MKVDVAKSKFIKGYNGPGDTVSNAFYVLELTDALTRNYDTDAHLVTYVVPGATRQPRINKLGLTHLLVLKRISPRK